MWHMRKENIHEHCTANSPRCSLVATVSRCYRLQDAGSIPEQVERILSGGEAQKHPRTLTQVRVKEPQVVRINRASSTNYGVLRSRRGFD